MNCGILGDSIALGLALANPGCDVSAKVGRATSAIVTHALPEQHYSYVILSAGSNDYKDPRLEDNLERIRSAVDTDKVIWIEPLVSSRARKLVRKTATRHGDCTAQFSESNDGIHPLSYAALWASVKLQCRKVFE